MKYLILNNSEVPSFLHGTEETEEKFERNIAFNLHE